MKIKEHKLQVLAALALAFSLGLAMPNAVFASEVNEVEAAEEAPEEGVAPLALEEGIDPQATTQPTTIDSSALFTLYTEVKADADYKNFMALATAVEPVKKDPAKATEAQKAAVVTAIKKINANAQVDNLDAGQLVSYAEAMDGYSLAQGAAEAVAKIEVAVGAGTAVTQQLIYTKMPAPEVQECYTKINAFVNRPTGTYADNIVKMYNKIKTDESFAGYRKAETLVDLTLKAEAGNYTGADIANLQQQIKTLIPTATGVDSANKDALVDIAKSLKDFDKYAALYNATAFIRDITKDGATLTSEAIVAALKDDKTIVAKYTAMGVAAAAIDPNVGNGLLVFETPNTSAPEEPGKTPPNTGVIGLFKEDGSLDLMAVTLLGAASLATLSGVIMLAKLYLHHKF